MNFKQMTDHDLEKIKTIYPEARKELMARDMQARVERERETKDRMNSGQMLNSDRRKMWSCP